MLVCPIASPQPPLGSLTGTFTFLTPSAFNLEGPVLVNAESGALPITNPVVATILEDDTRFAAEAIANSRGYLRPWSINVRGVKVGLRVPLAARFLKQEPAWQEVTAYHINGASFSAKVDRTEGRILTAKVAVQAFDRTQGDWSMLKQTTELELNPVSERAHIIDGATRFSVYGGIEFVNYLISNGLLELAALSCNSHLSCAVFPLANFLLRNMSGRNEWVLKEDDKEGTELKVQNGRLMDPKEARGRLPNHPLSVVTSDGNIGAEFWHTDNGDDYTVRVWEKIPLGLDETFSPFTQGIRRLAMAAAESVFTGMRLSIRG